MTLHLTPDLIEAVYELLRATPPFRRWKLPHADDVEFHVIKSGAIDGDCAYDGDRFTIRLSADRHSMLASTIATMAHEMCHMRYPRDRAHHGKLFKRLAAQVCAVHGFDPKTF